MSLFRRGLFLYPSRSKARSAALCTRSSSLSRGRFGCCVHDPRAPVPEGVPRLSVLDPRACREVANYNRPPLSQQLAVGSYAARQNAVLRKAEVCRLIAQVASPPLRKENVRQLVFYQLLISYAVRFGITALRLFPCFVF